MSFETLAVQVGKLALTLLVVGAVVWAAIHRLRKAERPGWLLFKWALTAALLLVFVRVLVPLAAANPFVGVPLVALWGIGLAVIWGAQIGELLARPLSSLYDGGTEPVEPRPFYSIAEARRKQGHYAQAIAEIDRQLEKFPTDFEGQMLLASIQAEDLRDLAAAETTILRVWEQPDHPPHQLAYALNTLADWQLRFGQNRQAARATLQRIVDRWPDTELALLAAQRIAHLEHPEGTRRSGAPIPVPRGVEDIGLMQSSAHLQPAGPDPAQLAAEYVAHLQAHPDDSAVREKLAVIYADHYKRLDLATLELNQLIEQPHQPARLVVHWLNLLADLQLRHGAGLETVRETLSRIIERYPHHAAADQARSRLNLLALEARARNPTPSLRAGL
ncbi:MAG: tetratricopeptide repeat protein [Verrucomicrobiae bacterium]|nr:tetratricopeptide repeat protein [Verrucomicrobiae bacterium]